MNWAILAILIAGILYFFLQSVDDKRADKAHEPRASTGKRVILFMFVALVCMVLTYFLDTSTNLFTVKHGGAETTPIEKIEAAEQITKYAVDGDTIHKNMLRNIHEDIEVGRPPF